MMPRTMTAEEERLAVYDDDGVLALLVELDAERKVSAELLAALKAEGRA